MMKPGQMWELVKGAATAWSNDLAPSMGAALAYYTIFSIAPLLVLLIAVAGAIFGADAARGQIVAELGGLMGKDGAAAIEGLLKSASRPEQSIVATLISLVTLLIGATTVFAELQSDLDRIWKAPAAIRPSGIWGLLRARFLSFGMIMGVGFLLIVSLVLSAGLSALGAWWGPLFSNWAKVLQVINFVVSFVVTTAAFAIVYKIMPSVKIRWHDVWIGAAVTALLFTIGKYLIGAYIGTTGVASGFGAAGSLATAGANRSGDPDDADDPVPMWPAVAGVAAQPSALKRGAFRVTIALAAGWLFGYAFKLPIQAQARRLWERF